jgi:hypothetical protein
VIHGAGKIEEKYGWVQRDRERIVSLKVVNIIIKS